MVPPLSFKAIMADCVLDNQVLCDCEDCVKTVVPLSYAKPSYSFFCSCDWPCDCVKGVCCEEPGAEVHAGTCASVLCVCAREPCLDVTLLQPLWPDFAYKPHQLTAIGWMMGREEARGGLLCDEMGLGKTMEVLGLMKNTPKMRQTLLLCPKAVISQWRVAAAKSRFTVLEVVDNGWKMTTPYISGQPMLFLSNYEKLATKSKDIFKARKWSRVVLDEAHRVRNMRSKLWKDINALQRQVTWCVTATPIVNNLKDIRGLFALIGYDFKRTANYAYLREVMTEACVHRSMEEMRPVLHELPSAAKITEELLDFETEEEAEFYRGIQGAIGRRWRALDRDQMNTRFELIMRLRQISLHPQVYINARKKDWSRYARDDWSGTSTKFTALRKKLESTEPARHIVFCQFHDEMDLLKEFLEKIPSVGLVQLYHGGITDKAKEAVIEATKTAPEDKHQILLLQLQSGGVGLNLQHFTKIIFMSPWWTSALMDQAIGRAVRIGQKETVEVTMLLLKEEQTRNIDKMMLELASGKREVLKELFAYASRGADSNSYT